MSKYKSHYDYLDANLEAFVKQLPLSPLRKQMVVGSIVCHGDKCYGYRDEWEKAGVPFERGTAVYLLSYATPYAQTVRETATGWVDVGNWVIDMYHNHGLKKIFEEIEV